MLAVSTESDLLVQFMTERCNLMILFWEGICIVALARAQYTLDGFLSCAAVARQAVRQHE